MSYPLPPTMAGPLVPPGPRRRPGTVTIAATLQILNVALLLASTAIILILLTQSAGDSSFTQTYGVVIGVQLAFAAATIVLALGNLRGKGWTRITTWVVAGLSMCCSLGNVAGGLGTFTVGGTDVYSLFPNWFRLVNLVGGGGQLLSNVLIVILLLLPASNAFFRKRPAPPPPAFGTHPG